MKSFRFPLQKILNYRRMMYKRKVLGLATLSQSIAKLYLEKENLIQKEDFFWSKEGKRDWQFYSKRESYMQASVLLKSENAQKISSLESLWKREKKKVFKAFQEKDILERVLDNKIKNYYKDLEKKEKKSLDDLILMNHNNWQRD